MTTSDTQRKQMDIKMKEDEAHKYEVPFSMTEYEVPIPMIKMTECEAYATFSYKPWHTQAMQIGVVFVEFVFIVYMLY